MKLCERIHFISANLPQIQHEADLSLFLKKCVYLSVSSSLGEQMLSLEQADDIFSFQRNLETDHLPLGLAFFTGFASMPSNDLFLLGTPFKKLRPWIVG